MKRGSASSVQKKKIGTTREVCAPLLAAAASAGGGAALRSFCASSCESREMALTE